MLVLTRKIGEKVRIGDVVVKIAEIKGEKVRLGIVAPADVPVHREEVYQAIHGQEVFRTIWGDVTPEIVS